MLGKYYDTRAHNRFSIIYTAVPYLDSQIFNMKNNFLRQSRKAKNRTSKAIESLQRTRQKSQQLSNGLKDSRIKREVDAKQFLQKLDNSNRTSLKKEHQNWQQYTADRTISKRQYMQDQAYLDSILTENTAKAASRLTTVRRWL